MDALEGLGDHGLDAEEVGALGGPVARAAHAVVFRADDDQRGACGLVVLGGIVDGLGVAIELRHAAFGAGNHEVLDAHVGEGAAGHHAVIAAAAAIAVEVGFADALFQQVLAGRGGLLEAASRADVIRGDAVAKDAECVGALDLVDVTWDEAEAFEERRLLDVGAVAIPLVHVAGAALDLVPLRILVGKAGVETLEHVGLQRCVHRIGDFLAGGPDVGKEDGVTVAAEAEGILGQIDVHGASDGEGDHQRWRHEEVGLDALVHAGFEVAVPGEHGGGDDVFALHHVFDALVEGAGVADAGGAAVADGLETKLVEFGLEAGLVEVIRHHAAAWAEAGLHAGLDGETACVRLFRQEAGGQHHAGVGSVRAARDRGDQHAAVGDGVGDAVLGIDLHFPERVAGLLAGFRHHADFGTELFGDCRLLFGSLRLAFNGLAGTHGRDLAIAVGGGLGEKFFPLGLQVVEVDAVLRALRSGHAGLHVGKVKIDHLGEFNRVAVGRDAPQALGLVVVFDGLAKLFRAAGAAQVGHGFFVDAEEAHRGAVFGGHVGNRRTVRHRQRTSAWAVELDKLAHDLGLAQHLGHQQHHVGGGHARGEFTREVHAHHFGNQEGHRLAQHAGLGLNAAYAPANDAQAVDHGGVRIRAHQGIRVEGAILFQHALGEVLEVHLMHDADARRHHLERVEGLLAPLQELVALAVAMEFEVQVALQRGAGASVIHLHAVVHHQVHRHQRLDHLGILAHAVHGAAHRGQIDQERHAGEVLQNDARHHERDFILARGLGVPAGQVLHIGFGDLLAVAIAGQGFQHDADRHRQTVQVRGDSGFFQRRKGAKLAGGTGTGDEGADCIECHMGGGQIAKPKLAPCHE